MTESALPAESPASGAVKGAGGASLPTLLWAAASVVFATGWIVERRRRRLLETEKDSILWADRQPPGASIITTAGGIDDILPDSPNAAESARAIYVTAIGETTSRREATLIDLHELEGKLKRRRNRGDVIASTLLLQQHLADFRYTSPWVFLELRELYRQLAREKEWEVARAAFRKRFGQNAPAWDAPSTGDASLLDDAQLCDGLANEWPYREARMYIVRWMLGDPNMRQQCSGPPLLALGVYRDMLMVDGVLDEVMDTRTVPVDSLL
ncbi:hypothetical protein [Ramlibacter sp. PS4R-6]|uniref:hypothetical protein n=1 Tax=Ramlibacter sp. PS4R-6 TaxID=3133438 RepID=UPI0030949212